MYFISGYFRLKEGHEKATIFFLFVSPLSLRRCEHREDINLCDYLAIADGDVGRKKKCITFLFSFSFKAMELPTTSVPAIVAQLPRM